MHILRYTESEAVISEEGAYVSSLKLDGIDVLQSSEDGQKTHGGLSLLIPYADIVYGAKYSYRGVDYVLPRNAVYENDFNNSIHGLTRDLKWRILKKGNKYVIMTCVLNNPGYPSELDISAKYSIKEDSFEVSMILENTGSQACPLMVGAHPYFISDGNWKIECVDPLIRLDGITNKETQPDLPKVSVYDSYSIESSKIKKYDDTFFGGGILSVMTKGIRIEFTRRNMPFFSVYNGPFAPENSFSIVPLTSAPNSFNNKFGLRELEPGKFFVCGFTMNIKK